MCAEGFGTFLLALFIFCLTEDCNVGRPSSDLQPRMKTKCLLGVISNQVALIQHIEWYDSALETE